MQAHHFKVQLVHSLALDRSIWDDVARELSRDAQVLTWDCRGHGRSGQPLTTYTPQLFARDLAELMDHVQWPSAVVGGCSVVTSISQAAKSSATCNQISRIALRLSWSVGDMVPLNWKAGLTIAGVPQESVE